MMLDSDETAANKFSPPSAVDSFLPSGVIGRGNDLNRRQCRRRPLHLALARLVDFVLIQSLNQFFFNLTKDVLIGF